MTSGPVSSSIDGEVGVILADHPPVNALSTALRRGLQEALDSFLADNRVRAIVVMCAGRTFFAGADISEMGKPPEMPTLHEVMRAIEKADKPVIAAIHGNALGGGLETAFVCHHRIAVPTAHLGLPEVHLGLLPGGGGTQRLPRVVGVAKALDLMVMGRTIGAVEALELGIIDAIAEGDDLRRDAVAFARSVLGSDTPLRRISADDSKIADAKANPEIFNEFRRAHPAIMNGPKAPENIVRAVEAAVNLPFEEGMAREWELFRELEDSIESAAQRHIFFAEREAAKVPGVRRDMTVDVKRVTLIGSGDEGAPVEEFCKRAKAEVTRFADWQDALDNGQESLAQSDLIIEAGNAKTPISNALLAAIDAIKRPDALLCLSDTAPIDRLAPQSASPSTLLRMAIPDPKGRLVEINRGSLTSDAATASLLQMVRKAGRVPLVSKTDGMLATKRLAAARALALSVLNPDGDGAPPTDAQSDGIPSPLTWLMANEGARMLDEGIVLRASDIDLAVVHAFGWPDYRGGPMFCADTNGLADVVRELRLLETHGNAFSPASGLIQRAENGERFTAG